MADVNKNGVYNTGMQCMSISTISTPSTERDLVLPSLILSADSPSVKTAMPATGQLFQRAGNLNSEDHPVKEKLSFALESELYNSWCSIGNIRNLSENSQIAEFLISFYQDQEKWKTRENCRTCGSDLTLHCPHCLTNHSTQLMESSNKTQEKQQVETTQGLLHTAHQLDKNESEKNHNNSTVKQKQEPVKGLSPVEEDHDYSSFLGASPNYDSDVIDETLIKCTPACDIIFGPVEVPAELINVAGKKIIERSTQEKVIQHQNKLTNPNTSLDKVPNASALLPLNPFIETSICQKLSEDSQSKQNPVQTLSLPKASISVPKASNCLISPDQAVKRAIVVDTEMCEGPPPQKQMKLTLLKSNDLFQLPELHTRKAASALDQINVNTPNNSVEGQQKHTAGTFFFIPVNSILGLSPESQVMVCSQNSVQGQQNLKQVASPEKGDADVLPQLLATDSTDGQVTNSKIGTGKLNQEKLNQNQFKIFTHKNFISKQALKAGNIKTLVHNVDNMPVQGQPNNPVKMNTKEQTQVQPNNPVKITTPVQAQHNNPVKMNTPLQLQPQRLMKINTLQDQPNNPVKIKTPVQKPPNKPKKVNTSLQGRPNKLMKINTPVQAPLNNPVITNTIGQTPPNKPIKINTPVQGQPNNASPYKPVKITTTVQAQPNNCVKINTPVQILPNNQVNINTPVQEPPNNPVNINTPLQEQPNNCVKIKTPVQVQPYNPVMINTAVQGQLNNPVVISTPGEAPANHSIKTVPLLKKNAAVPLSKLQATNTCSNVSNSKVTQDQTKLMPVNLKPSKFVKKEKDNIASPQTIPATNSSISNKTNGQTVQTPVTMILFLKKLDSVPSPCVQSVNAVTNPVPSPCIQSVNAVTNPVPSPCVQSVNSVTNPQSGNAVTYPVPSSCVQSVNAVTNQVILTCVQSVNAVTNQVSSLCVQRVNAVSNTVPPQSVLSVNTVCNQVDNSRENLTCCPVCKKTFLTLTSMKLHQNLIHGGHRPFKCDQCDEGFGMASMLKEHKLVHSDVPPYSCFCGKSFKTTMRLKAHSKAVHTSSDHICEVCGKAFKLPKYLERHRQAMHQGPKRHACEFCDKRFHVERSMIRHRSRHTGEQRDKKSRKVTCETCGKLYNWNYIERHKRMHTGEKPYSCSICGKSFPYFVSYSFHMRAHKGERPYMCELCGKSFGRSANLAIHKQCMHDDGSRKVFQCQVCLKVIKTPQCFKRHVQNLKCGKKPLEQVLAGTL